MPKRSFDRADDQFRPLRFHRGFLLTAHGSVLVECGNTRVLCTAMVQAGVPPFKVGSGTGWVTAEYAMLPGSTPQRKERKPDGRATEIQRLIGRALRAVCRMDALGEVTVYVDCDVLQADGGTRTAAITGGYLALSDALQQAVKGGLIAAPAAPLLTDSVAAVSVGIVAGRAVLDLDYPEDSKADVDMNVAMTGTGKFIEVQGTGEGGTFDDGQLAGLLELAKAGCRRLTVLQAEALAGPLPACLVPPRPPPPPRVPAGAK